MNTAREYTDRLFALLHTERNTLADFILVLAEFDRLELFRELGYASLFAFLQRELGLSDGLAYFRMKACRLVRDFPEVVEPLRDGRLCVTNVVELAKVITAGNRHEVLPRYFHVSKREAEAITVSIQPKAVVPTRSVATPVRAPALALEAAVGAEPKRAVGVGMEVPQLAVEDASTPAPVVASGAACTTSRRRASTSATPGWIGSRGRRGARLRRRSRRPPASHPVRSERHQDGRRPAASRVSRWCGDGSGPRRRPAARLVNAPDVLRQDGTETPSIGSSDEL